MFTTLLESKGSRRTSSRWLPASAVIHGALLAGVITHSPAAPAHEPAVHEPPRIVWIEPRPQEAGRSSAPGARSFDAGPARAERPMPRFDGAPGVDLPDVQPSAQGAAIGAGDNLSPTTSFGAPGGSGLSSGTGAGPRWAAQVDKVALPLPGNRVPAYPGVLRSAGMEGSVTLRFVVDTAGAVERGSVIAIRSDHELFTAATLRAIATHRFLPAEVGGARVRMLVEQRFEFSLGATGEPPARR